MFLRWLGSLTVLLFALSISVFAQTKRIYLSELHPNVDIFRGISSEDVIKVPVPYRWVVKKARLYIEVEKSSALVESRSGISVFLNGNLIYQKRYNPKVDIISAKINIPKEYLNKDYNNLKIAVSQHYCINCCEYEASPELWSKVNWEKSYIEVEYEEKPFAENLLYVRDYILDDKQYSPIEFGIILENKSDFFILQGAKISGYLGKAIKYRNIHISLLNRISPDKDIFIIGRKEFVRKFLNIKETQELPNVFVKVNPLNKSKALVVITADTQKELQRVIDALISIDEPLVFGKDLNVDKFKKPEIKAYMSPLYLPVDEKVPLSLIKGYDGRFFGIFPPPYNIDFYVPPDIFLEGKDKITFHLAYNYGAGIREDSVINIFINDKFLKALKIKKNYGTILEETEIKIPVYMLKRGHNRITVQYALMPANQGFCVAPNINALQGTVFADKSYLCIPDLPHWVEMPYLEYFVSTIYPFSIYPDLSDTQILLTTKTDRIISSLFTLMAYIGEKTLVPPYSLSITSTFSKLEKDKNLIVIGYNIPQELFENMPLSISNNQIDVKYPLFKSLKEKLFPEEKTQLLTKLLIKNKLTNEVLFLFGESPYKSGKTVLLLISKNDEFINKAIKNLYDPKFTSKIKGDVAVVDFYKNIVFSTSIGEKYYVGHLPWYEYILYKLGYSFWFYLLVFFIVVLIMVIVVKILLDYREKRRLRGET